MLKRFLSQAAPFLKSFPIAKTGTPLYITPELSFSERPKNSTVLFVSAGTAAVSATASPAVGTAVGDKAKSAPGNCTFGISTLGEVAGCAFVAGATGSAAGAVPNSNQSRVAWREISAFKTFCGQPNFKKRAISEDAGAASPVTAVI